MGPLHLGRRIELVTGGAVGAHLCDGVDDPEAPACGGLRLQQMLPVASTRMGVWSLHDLRPMGCGVQ